MAIDTHAKKLSLINAAVPIPVLPLPAPDGSGTITWSDRSHLAGLYSGISPIMSDIHPLFVTGSLPFYQATGSVPYFEVFGVV